MAEDPTQTRQVEHLPAQPRIVHLDVQVEGAPSRRVAVTGDALVIGRSRESDLQLDVEGVSRKHARISRTGDRGYNLVDLGAKNGTFLNGERVDVAMLHHGDRIQIATAELVVRFDDAAAPAMAASARPVHATLSAREWEVAEAVAEGLTNAEIAARLGISRRTVATHLERIFERLELHSRAALAHCVALERGRG